MTAKKRYVRPDDEIAKIERDIRILNPEITEKEAHILATSIAFPYGWETILNPDRDRMMANNLQRIWRYAKEKYRAGGGTEQWPEDMGFRHPVTKRVQRITLGSRN